MCKEELGIGQILSNGDPECKTVMRSDVGPFLNNRNHARVIKFFNHFQVTVTLCEKQQSDIEALLSKGNPVRVIRYCNNSK